MMQDTSYGLLIPFDETFFCFLGSFGIFRESVMLPSSEGTFYLAKQVDFVFDEVVPPKLLKLDSLEWKV